MKADWNYNVLWDFVVTLSISREHLVNDNGMHAPLFRSIWKWPGSNGTPGILEQTNHAQLNGFVWNETTTWPCSLSYIYAMRIMPETMDGEVDGRVTGKVSHTLSEREDKMD